MAPRTRSFLLLLLLISSSSYFPSKARSQTTADEDEKRILLQIKTDWGNPSALQSWNDSAANLPHCNWTGIQCIDGSVAGISLFSQSITGEIPPSICNLKNLSSVDLYDNNLPGTFPTYLYNCSNLQYLDLSQNLFAGEIPSDLYRMSKLTFLSLSANNFTGDIPRSISRLPSIQELRLDNNLFNGSFPAEFGNISTLETLLLAYNPFTPAIIPPEFGNMSKLSYLWMTQTNLMGEIPVSFGNLKALVQLDLAMNSLSGRIPGEVWMLEKLELLYLFDNNLSGEIKGPIGALGLTRIDVSINQLNGSIPEDFGNLQNLSVLLMYHNRFSGEIPASIGRIPVLSDVRLYNNSLTGVLPTELGKHSMLWNLEVSDNSISGELPENLCDGEAFASLVVFNNNLTGKLPETLGNCSTLSNLQIYNNNFSGEVPSGLWSSVNLSTVIMRDNALSGTLPDKLPWNLSRLDIGNNRFSGSIPSSAGSLMVFKASNNLFSGEIPSSFAGISQLQILSLGGNLISGDIPQEISSLRSLTDLNLSSNQLTGNILASIASLPVLTSLDLSENQISGEIPPELDNLRLNFLNLSSNLLSGEVPIMLQDQVYDRSFLSNPGLCSTNSLLNIRSCREYESDGSDEISRGLRILFIALGALAFLVIVVFGFFVLRDYRRRKNGSDLTTWKLTSFHSLRFNESNILRGLTGDNLIGSGGSGQVYRIALGNRAGEMVAVKKIWNSRKLDSKLEREFQAEVQILGSIRHTNIVKLLCCISSVDSKLLVYEYMENGSLDRWLHGRRPSMVRGGSERSGPLDWPTRLGIAVGAARGLCYMHHDCSPAIVHRDVKSSNILLDSEFRAKIADFGLARMLVSSGEPNSVSVVAGSFGYMAPECAYTRKVSEKVDVYSFGVVLLELSTGREASEGGEHGSLAEWVWRHFQEGNKAVDALDSEIRDPSYLDEMLVVLKLGLICTGTLPSTRPSMKDVLQILLRCCRTPGIGGEMPVHGESDVLPLLHLKNDSRRKSPSHANENDDGACNV